MDPHLVPHDPTADSADALVRRTLAGDKEAFAEIVRRHQRELWRLATRLVGDPTAAEGLVQQTLLNAYESLERYETGRDFPRWLRTILLNLARNELRRRHRETERLAHYGKYLLALMADEEEANARLERLETAFRACREDMAPLVSQVIDLRYRERRSVEQIAEAIGRTAAATRQLLFRVRSALRRCVEGRLAAG